MIGHVASAREARGRVVLRLGCGADALDTAFEAAALIAQAFDSEIEGLFVEDRQLFDLTGYPFVREIPLSGEGARPISMGAMEREIRTAMLAARQRLARLSRRTTARTFCTAVREDPLTALAQACSRAGPWNVIVMGEPLSAGDGPRFRQILERVRDATGLVTVGQRRRVRIGAGLGPGFGPGAYPGAGRGLEVGTRRDFGHGPVVVAVEDPERLPPMLRTAQRLANSCAPKRPVRVLLVTESPQHRAWAEGQVRLVLAHDSEPDVSIAPPCYGESAVAAEAIRRLGAGFLICQFGGLTAPEDNLRPLAQALECPLFFVR